MMLRCAHNMIAVDALTRSQRTNAARTRPLEATALHAQHGGALSPLDVHSEAADGRVGVDGGFDGVHKAESERKIGREAAGPSWAQHAAVVGLVVFFAIWGVLIRLGLTAIWTFDGTPVVPLLWSQIVGCALMGFFVASKNGIETQCVPSLTRLC